MSKVKPAWDGQYQAFNDALKYMLARRDGDEKSIQTPWPKFNDAVTDGLEWNTLTVIGGRPGSGKTLIKDQIIRESFILNPAEDYRVLEFSFEMVGRTTALREFSSITGKTYKELCNKVEDLSQKAQINKFDFISSVRRLIYFQEKLRAKDIKEINQKSLISKVKK